MNLVETEEVLGKGETIRSQEGALGSDLTELLEPRLTESATQDQEVPRGYLKASSWDGARLGQRPENPQTKYKGRVFGVELGSAAADCFSWAASQVGRNSTSISPFTVLCAVVVPQ